MVPGDGALVSRFDLAAARRAAAAALGRSAESVLGKLDAAGLVVVLKADLPDSEQDIRTLLDVTLVVPDDWRSPWACTVITGSETLDLHAAVDAVPGVREARLLREVMGGQLHVEIDEAEGLLLRAWREE